MDLHVSVAGFVIRIGTFISVDLTWQIAVASIQFSPLTLCGLVTPYIGWHRSRSILAQVMAWCLMAPSHYLNQYWPRSSKVFCGFRLRAFSPEVLMNTCSDITLKKSLDLWHHMAPLGPNELTLNPLYTFLCKKDKNEYLLYPPYPRDRGMLWFYVEAARRPPPAARNGVNAITQKPRDGLFSNLVYTLVVIVSWPD